MSLNTPIKVNKGESLGYAFDYQMPAGTWAATSQLRKVSDNSLIQNLVAAIIPPVTPSVLSTITIKATDEQTTAWPTETLKFDVRFEDTSGNVFYIPSAEYGPIYLKPCEVVTHV